MQQVQTVNIVTLGCSKNQVDSEVIASQLQARGYIVYHESEKTTDIVLINTCAFILDAKEQSIETILMFADEKKKKRIKKLYVMGCLVERYRDELANAIPEVDGYFGFSDLNQIFGEAEKFDLLGHSERLLSSPKHYAYLKISEGCNRHCSYCAIPGIRGKHISKPKDLIIKEAEGLVEKGVKEIMLIAQDLTCYGIDLYKRRDLESLLRSLAQVKGLEWIRLHYAYPLNFPYEILDVMRDYPTICRYLDIPLQHISDNILESMQRGSNKQQIYNLIEKMREKVPGIAIRTTLISGYPNETRENHKELVQFLKDMRFERVGVFAYSQEEGTPAFPLGDPIKQAEKNRRVEELMAVQEEISLELNRARIDSVMKVIVDEELEDGYLGRTEFDSPEVDNEVLIEKVEGEPLTVGEFYPVRITDADAFELVGRRV
ncbi:MAG: 30S ribosomal protein S12 methylthiotransferase RimO [Bacteroidales bacterium]|nr:30S ribosomal protein S12 methylthiotransferase RimO [Bacteroidales bacterium]